MIRQTNSTPSLEIWRVRKTKPRRKSIVSITKKSQSRKESRKLLISSYPDYREIERELETTTCSKAKEKDLMNQLEQVKASPPFIKEFARLTTEIEQKKEEKKQIQSGIAQYKTEGQRLKSRIEELKKGTDTLQTQKEGISKQLDKINADKKAMHEEISNLYDQKHKIKEDYYGKLLAYEKQQMEIK